MVKYRCRFPARSDPVSYKLFKIFSNLIAPSGIACFPDSQRENVRVETSTCRAAFDKDRPRDKRNSLSSCPDTETRALEQLVCHPSSKDIVRDDVEITFNLKRKPPLTRTIFRLSVVQVVPKAIGAMVANVELDHIAFPCVHDKIVCMSCRTSASASKALPIRDIGHQHEEFSGELKNK